MAPKPFKLSLFLLIIPNLFIFSVGTNFPGTPVNSLETFSSILSNLHRSSPESETTYDSASLQLQTWAAQHPQSTSGTVRNDQGCPVPSLTASLGIGSHGQLLLQDQFLLNKLAQFSRERIPERVVHAKGNGAFGYFRVTHDISTLTKADFLNSIGKTTPVVARFSTVAGESGSPDTIRDSIGFAIKFFTIDGIHDFAGSHQAVFPIRDPFLFPDLNKSRKRNPQTHIPDSTTFWDFSSLRPEVILHTVMAFSDFAANSRVFDDHSIHAFKFVNREGVPHFVKLHFLSQQPFKWFNSTELKIVSGMDPDYATRDLFNAIANEDYPKWQLNIQVMSLEQARDYPVNPFDSTKVWRVEEFPMRPVGELVLNKNPDNYFEDVEQVALDPGRMVPGIEPSLDRLLLGRIFAYGDAQRYRLGVNFAQLRVNRPGFNVSNYERDGVIREGMNGKGGPNYFPNSFHGPEVNGSGMESVFHKEGLVDIFDKENDTDDNFRLARLYLYKDLTENQRRRVAGNLGGSLAKAVKDVRERAVRNLFYRISEQFGDEVWAEMEKTLG